MAAVQTTKTGKKILNGEFISWLAIIIILNAPLLSGDFADRFVFFTDRVASGEWWRVLTFPFVHVSVYHLLLDSLAFLWLWHDMRDLAARKRWGVMVACWGGSLILPLLLSEQIDVHGLAGLSGIGHGLFAFYCLDCARRAKAAKDQVLYRASLVLVTGLVIKSGLEVFAGQLLFVGLHFGPIGVPIVETHLGGMIGGILAYICLGGPTHRPVHDASVPFTESDLKLEGAVKRINNNGHAGMDLLTSRALRKTGGKHV